jgi:hypothetical protein
VAAPYCGVTVSRGVEKGVTVDFRHFAGLENGTGGGGGAPTTDTENLGGVYLSLSLAVVAPASSPSQLVRWALSLNAKKLYNFY